MLEVTQKHVPGDAKEATRVIIEGGMIYQESPYFSSIEDIKQLKHSSGSSLKVAPGNLDLTRCIGNVYAKIPSLGAV